MGAILLFGYVMLVSIVQMTRMKDRRAGNKIAYYGTIVLLVSAMAIGLMLNVLGG